MTEICKRPGIESLEEQESRCLKNACLNSNVVRMRQDGSLAVILQWNKASSVVKCVFIGSLRAVIGL